MDSVQPLRISKPTPSSTPNKMAAGRPLSEIVQTSQRRNSPSYNQATRKAIVSREASPYTENPAPTPNKSALHDFWSTRDPMSPSRFDENTPERSPSPSSSPRRRPSVEKLMQASRVKNSNMFTLESKDAYDPATMPVVERPSANRPLSQQLANNTFARYDSLRKENNPLRSPGHRRTDSSSKIPVLKSPASANPPVAADRQSSPPLTKSSLSRHSQYDLNKGAHEDERSQGPRLRHRHQKSVTFHEEPPEVKEYEQQTPEPSLSVASDREGSWESDEYYDQDASFERNGSLDPAHDDSFDADLENADKTPVVLPGDWSRMSPSEAQTCLVDRDDDVFGEATQRPVLGRSESVTSDGESRPLPPIPAFQRRHRDSDNIASLAERASLSARGVPSPPKRASCSKEDILKMTSKSSLTLEERLTLMSKQAAKNRSAQSSPAPNSSELVVTNLDTGERLSVDATSLAGLSAPPRICRESILRKVRNTKYDFEDNDSEEEDSGSGADATRPSYTELAKMHPDEPIPSRENSRETSSMPRAPRDVIIKSEPVDEDEIDMASIPAAFSAPRGMSQVEDEFESSVIRHRNESDAEDSPGPDGQGTPSFMQADSEVNDGKETLQDAMQLLTVKDYSEPTQTDRLAKKASMELLKQTGGSDFMQLPQYLSTDDYGFGLEKYITPSPPPATEKPSRGVLQSPLELKPSVGVDQQRPDSSSSNGDHSKDVESYHESEFAPEEAPEIPERRATIKTGGRLKTRASASAADFQIMAEQRRIVSNEHPVPPIPQAYQAEIESTNDSDDHTSYSSEGQEFKADSAVDARQEERTNKLRECKSMPMSLDIPSLHVEDNDGLDLDAAFDKVIESSKVGTPFPAPAHAQFPAIASHQPPGSAAITGRHRPLPHSPISRTDIYTRTQKGYVTRENTKVVIASHRNVSGESNSTVKSSDPLGEARPGLPPKNSKNSRNLSRQPSAEQFLKTEPWNGAMRRKSSRNASTQRAATHLREPAPPLPGALSVVNEDFAAGSASLEDDVADGVERGRLFVKVVGVKELNMPFPRNERLSFQLTLDNGLHCVTTADLDLGRSAAIGQEFELVVLNDLEFQLTLTTKLAAPPAARTPSPRSPLKAQRTPRSGLSRFLTSPKKRAEKERQEREALEAEERRVEEEDRRRRALQQPTSWDLLHELVNDTDGSFARAYVNLKSHERQCFGRPLAINVPCYNEWTLENDAVVMNSVRSKRGTHSGPIRKPPYIIGYLELHLLYVPKPKGAKDEEMPKSMSAAVREMNKASENREVICEGHLSQQGGDCIHWRRRFFRLHGPRLTAYHEHTHQKRAVINLSKASRMVDDRTTLIADPATLQKGSKGRRKSAFAEEDEGYQYVEEGFRIRFANGETIDFYADSRAEKERWMEVLSKVIGKADTGAKATSWTDLVMGRERIEALGHAQEAAQPPQRRESKRKGVPDSAPTSPVKQSTRPKTPPMSERRAHRNRDAVKSMIF